jgi:hypothetical protein
MRSPEVVTCHRNDDKWFRQLAYDTPRAKRKTALTGNRTPADTLALIVEAVHGDEPAHPSTVPADAAYGQALAALVALRHLRAILDGWEPALIQAARDAGATWTQLAAVLGVGSRQAAERRYLRMREPAVERSGATRDQRVEAERDLRAGNRAVTAWARANSADLRRLAGQISALTDLGAAARPGLDRLHHALGDDDATVLLPLLADIQRHLAAAHAALAERIDAVTGQADQVRQESAHRRTSRRAGSG